jgi:hypothetical protein
MLFRPSGAGSWLLRTAVALRALYPVNARKTRPVSFAIFLNYVAFPCGVTAILPPHAHNVREHASQLRNLKMSAAACVRSEHNLQARSVTRAPGELLLTWKGSQLKRSRRDAPHGSELSTAPELEGNSGKFPASYCDLPDHDPGRSRLPPQRPVRLRNSILSDRSLHQGEMDSTPTILWMSSN